MRRVRAGLVATGITLASGAAGAQAPATQALVLNVDSSYVVVDQWVEQALRRWEIAGAALAIVRDGRVVHARGFGLADVARGVRVDAETTVFHIASVTKLVTAVAALQQVEAGRLSLQADVRPMLGEIGAAGWARNPVTLHELLTHTAGLDTRWIGSVARRPADVQPLAEHLREAMPRIVDRPGSVVRYSNYGYAAAGRLVEVASGMSWADDVEQDVFAPLGMRRSSARPRERSVADAVPYRYRDDTLPEPDLYEHTAPAGAVRMTAGDLARFVAALLDTVSSTPLSPAGKALVLTSQTTTGAGVRGYAYGTFPYPNAHVPAMSSGGELPGFSTRVLFVPRLGLGVVLMVNRKDPTLAVSVFDSLLARVSPSTSDAPACVSRSSGSTAVPADVIAGSYRSNVYERGSFLRIGALLGPTLTVRADTGGRLFIVNPADDSEGWWRRGSDSTWIGPAGQCLAIVGGDGPSMLALSTKDGPLMLERVTAASSPSTVLPVVLAALLALVVAAGAGVRGIGLTVSLVHVAFFIAYVVGLYQLAIAYDDRFAFGIPRWFSAVLAMPYLALALTVVLVYALIARDVTKPRRSWVVVAASGVLVFVYWSWRAIWPSP